MKKHLLKLGTFLLIGGMLFTGCKKEDDTAPVITIIGDALVDHILNQTYNDAGATATDDEDGDITALIVTTNNVDEDLAGSYNVTYSVSDAAGNSNSATRTVNVYNEADIFAGGYDVMIQCPGLAPYNYSENIGSSVSNNRRIIFGKFGDYTIPSGTKVFADVNIVAGTVTMPAQTIADVGNPPTSTTFSGTGTISTAGGVTTMVLTITETAARTATCSYTYTSM